MIDNLFPAVAAFGIALGGVALALRYARRAGVIDIPNPRSSHLVPTPRGGGLALVWAVVIGASYELAGFAHRYLFAFSILVGAVVALTVVGWMDDHGSMRVLIRLGVHLICGAAVALLVNQIMPLSGIPNVAWLAWWAFWTVASINIVNFMDGLDGMIAAQGIVYGIYLVAILPASAPATRFGLILAAACLGFLVWNWAPARMFMGDVGSGPLGLFLVVGGALALGGVPIALIFLPLFPLFLDALLTLVIRFRRGETLTDAHRSHLYQRLANGGWGHAPVTSLYAITAAIGALVGLFVKDASATRVAVAIIGYTASVMIGWKLLHEKFLDTSLLAKPAVTSPGHRGQAR